MVQWWCGGGFGGGCWVGILIVGVGGGRCRMKRESNKE